MNAKDGAEGAELKPANEDFSVGGIVGIAADETANIRCPIRQAGDGKVQARGYLALEAFPIGIHVARPRRDRVALRAGECRSRQNEHALPVARVALPLINSLGRQQRIQVRVAIAAADEELVSEKNVFLLSLGL